MIARNIRRLGGNGDANDWLRQRSIEVVGSASLASIASCRIFRNSLSLSLSLVVIKELNARVTMKDVSVTRWATAGRKI